MNSSSISPGILQELEDKLHAMTQAMVSGLPAEVACLYADNALLTDLKDFRVEGRAAIDSHWAKLPPYLDWQLQPLETGGDADLPHQRLHSIAHFRLKDQVYVDEGYCFVIWRRQADGDYRIQVDIYHPLKFGPVE